MSNVFQGPFDADIRAALSGHGDDGRVPRHTVFYFYGGNFGALMAAATAAGYTVGPTVNNDGAILETITAVDEASFERHALQMAKWADEFDCEYDNWECQVVQQ